MHGNLVNMVQKNMQNLKSEVKNVIRKSNIDTLPNINRNSANIRTNSY